jgi:ribosomal protein S18 acetylase RimI-like enzyme
MYIYRTFKSYSEFDDKVTVDDLIDFLFVHLDRFGDTKKAIAACLDYAMSDAEGKGGFILMALQNDKIAGAVVMIETGMKWYIPEYFLVYIAVHKDNRNQGLGGKLMGMVMDQAAGDIALHVEYDNPAKRLYERVGFQSKYAEMRYQKEE